MNSSGSRSRRTRARWAAALCFAGAIAGIPGHAPASEPFLYGSEPVHPACIHALVMQQEEPVPVTTAVSLEGCAASRRSEIRVRYEGEIAVIEDKALLAGGSFGYRELTQLDNGIFALAILRVLPDGEQRVSLAAVDIVERPMLRTGRVVHVKLLELLGEVWVPDIQVKSFRSVGNVVHFSSGLGPKRIERTVDFTRLGKARK